MSAPHDTATATSPGDGAVGERWARPAPGTLLGRYALDEKIGAGAMGVVYAARDTVLGREVALKVIRPRRVHSEDAQRRFEREARLLAAVEHTAVIDVYDVGQHAGRCYLVMPRLPGRTLRDWFAQQRSVQEIVSMFEQVAAGLEAAHAAGVLHCDFKPDNVLLDAAGHPIVADFGLARLSSLQTQPEDEHDDASSGQASGTPGYMAPELQRGAAPSISTDLYAFHVSLFEALAGRRPFAAGGGRSLLEAKLHGLGPTGAARLPRRLRKPLVQALDPDPGRRPRCFASLAPPRAGLGGILGGLAAAGALGAIAAVVPMAPDAAPCPDRARAAILDSAHWQGSTGSAAVRATVQHVEAGLDRWRGGWRAAYEQACEAGDDARIECLTKIRVAGESWMRPQVGATDLDAATAWAGKMVALPELPACAPGPDERVPDAALLEALEEARFSHDRGDAREAVAQALAAAARASAMGETDLAFKARILAGEALIELREFDQARAILDDVVAAAEATAHWEAAARAMTQLIWVIAAGDVDLGGARRAARKVDAYARRSTDEAFLRAEMLVVLSAAFERVGDNDAAAEHTDAALALCAAHPEDRRFDPVLDILLAQRISVAAKNNDYPKTLELAAQLPVLEDAVGPYALPVLISRSALAHAHGIAGRFEPSIAGFDRVADRYAQMGHTMGFWAQQTRVNAAEMELRAGHPQRALNRLQAACPAMAAAVSETHGNVLLCSLITLQAQTHLGAPVDLAQAEEILGTLEARFDSTRFVVQQARGIVADIGVALGESGRVRALLDVTVPVPALEAELAWLRAQAEPQSSRAVAKYEAVCEVTSQTLRPDLCWRALKKIRALSVTIDPTPRLQALERAVPELTQLR